MLVTLLLPYICGAPISWQPLLSRHRGHTGKEDGRLHLESTLVGETGIMVSLQLGYKLLKR